MTEGEDEAEDIPAQLWLLLPADLIRPILKRKEEENLFQKKKEKHGIDQINLKRENKFYGE